MARARHRKQRRPMAGSTWLTAGATTLGVGAALLSGAAVAAAAPSSDSSHSTGSDSSSKSSSTHKHSTKSSSASNSDGSTGSSDSSGSSASSGSSGSSDSSSTDSSGTKTNSSSKQTHSNNHARSAASQKAAAATDSTKTADSTASSDSSTKSSIKKAVVTPAAATTSSTASPAASTSPTPAASAAAATASATSAAATTTAATTSGGTSSGSSAAAAVKVDISGVLSVLAAVGQALTVAARDTQLTLTKDLQSTSLTLSKDLTGTVNTVSTALAAITGSASSAASTATPTSGTSTTGTDGAGTSSDPQVATAITEIKAAQTAYNAAVKASWWASWTNGYSGYDLGVALKDLTKYQANQDTLLAAYSANPTSSNLSKLQANEALTGAAASALKQAAAWSNIAGLKTAAAAGAVDARIYGQVALQMYLGTEPIVYMSINGGPMVKVLVDTGSTGLVIPAKYVGTASSLGNAVNTTVLSSGFGTGVGSAAVTYDYNQYNTTVSFGNGLTTGSVTVNIVTAATQSDYTKYIGQDGVVGVLGIGTNAVGPGGSVVSTALPGELADGLYLNEKTKTLTFGPNPLPVVTSVSGSPNVSGYVSVNGGTQTAVNLLIDSGGVFGTIPQSIAGSSADSSGYLKSGTAVSIYSSDGTLLYTYKTTSTNTPTVTVDTAPQAMNTGYEAFALGPVYINYSTSEGSTDFDY